MWIELFVIAVCYIGYFYWNYSMLIEKHNEPLPIIYLFANLTANVSLNVYKNGIIINVDCYW